MAGSGKLLEAFIKQIEEILLPQGITITVNDKVYNEEGIQIAEFDILIDGKIGSTKLKWLIECRDRPSQGPAPGSWIEQLIGRRSIHGFNKVIAVSTTGFSPGAKLFAEKKGIEIRTVTNESVDQIRDWFLVETMTLFRRGGRLDHATLFVSESESAEIKDALLNKLKETDATQPLLEPIDKVKPLTLVEAFQGSVAQAEALYDELMQEGGTKNINFRVSYPRDDSHYLVDTELGKVRITEIHFLGELSVSKEEIPIGEIRKYENLSDGEEIATTASFNIDIDGKPVEISFKRIPESGQTHVFLTTKSN
jgi:hypothetical protein